MKQTLCVMTLLSLTSGSANAALVSRAGGQAYYDTDTDLSWVADANLAQTSGYDADGLMNWTTAQAWIGSLNTATYLGTNDWRLPTVTDTGTPGCNFGYTGTDCGYNVNLVTGEMARMFYSTLGNTAAYNTSGDTQPCIIDAAPNYCLTNTGPFSNLQPYLYWSGTASAAGLTGAWGFSFNDGSQALHPKSIAFFAWAVRPGDIGNVIDSDSDGVVDNVDNCNSASNASQCDSDGDGYGNRCDGDLNDNGFTNAQDTTLYRQQLGQPSVGPTFNEADLNCNGFVNAQDTTLFRQLLGNPPGPSGLAP